MEQLKKSPDIGKEEIRVEYSEELIKLKVELISFLYNETKGNKKKMIKVANLINEISEKTATEAYSQGFSMGSAFGYDTGCNDTLSVTWELEENHDYCRIGVQKWAYFGDDPLIGNEIEKDEKFEIMKR